MRNLPRLAPRVQVAARRTRGSWGNDVLATTVMLGAMFAAMLGQDGKEAKGAARAAVVVPRIILLVIFIDRRQRRWVRWRVRWGAPRQRRECAPLSVECGEPRPHKAFHRFQVVVCRGGFVGVEMRGVVAHRDRSELGCV